MTALAQACGSDENPYSAQSKASLPPVLTPTVAWYGDSLAAGSCRDEIAPPEVLAQVLGPSWSVSNHGVPGESAGNIRERYEATWDSACQGASCGWYFFEGGVNSLKDVSHVSPAEALEDMTAMVDDARSRGRHVAWFGILPFKGCTLCTDTTEGVLLAKEYNALMAQACADRLDVSCFLPYSEFEDPDRPDYLSPKYTCDGIHLNKAGAERLVDLVRGLFPPDTERPVHFSPQ